MNPTRLTQSSLIAAVLFLTPLSLAAASPVLIEEVVPSGPDAVLPRLLSQTAAVYPADHVARDNESVIVSFTVTSDGKIKDPKILGTPATRLENPAKKAVLAWKFQPGSRLGKPADFRLKAPVTFSVNTENIDDAPAVHRKVAAV